MMERVLFITVQPFNVKQTAAVNRLECLTKGLSSNGTMVEIWSLYPSKDLLISEVGYKYRNLTLFKCSSENLIVKFILFVIGYISLIFHLLISCTKRDIVINYLNNLLYVDAIVLLIKYVKGYKSIIELTEHPSIYFNNKKIRSLFEKYILINYNGVYVISQSLLKYVKDLKPNVPIELINMTVDKSRFNSLPEQFTRLHSKDKYIAYCGSLINEKDGVIDLILAFGKITHLCPGYKLKIVGSGSDEAVCKIKKVILDHNLYEKVILLGAFNKQKVVDFLINAQVLVLARPDSNQAKFGFPTKVGEYLASEVPLVITDTGEVTNFIKNGIHALVVPPGNIDDISNAVLTIVENPIKYLEMAKQGKLLTDSVFSNHVQGKKLKMFLSKISSENN